LAFGAGLIGFRGFAAAPAPLLFGFFAPAGEAEGFVARAALAAFLDARFFGFAPPLAMPLILP
jgi:hypothetical protein